MIIASLIREELETFSFVCQPLGAMHSVGAVVLLPLLPTLYIILDHLWSWQSCIASTQIELRYHHFIKELMNLDLQDDDEVLCFQKL